MFGLLSLAFRRGGLRAASEVVSLLKKGFSCADVGDLLRTAGSRDLRGEDIRHLQKETERLIKECEKLQKKRESKDASHAAMVETMLGDIEGLQAHVDALQENLTKCTARLEAIGPSESTCLVLAEALGHKRSILQQQHVDAAGKPLPAYSYPAISYLGQIDLSARSVLEFGSGNSTSFWSECAEKVVSIFVGGDSEGRNDRDAVENIQHFVAQDPAEAASLAVLCARKFDVVVLDCGERFHLVEAATQIVSDEGMIILNESDWHPATASLLRGPDVIQVDFEGFGSLRPHLFTTSIFLKRKANFAPGKARQPSPSPGSLPTVRDTSLLGGVERPGLRGLDQKLAQYLGFEGGFFVEARAGDGFEKSNTFYLENSLRWTGLLIEPDPDLASNARYNRARSMVCNCALGGDEIPAVSISVPRKAAAKQGPARASDASTFAVQQAGPLHNAQNEDVHAVVQVPGRTLTSVLNELHPSGHVDFFSLHADGSELEVLKGLDFSRHAPRWILANTLEIDALAELLRANRYTQVVQLTFHDYLFRHGA